MTPSIDQGDTLPPPPPPPDPALAFHLAVWRAGKRGALGCLLLIASFATVVIGARTANQPHEVEGETLFAALLIAHVIVGVLTLRALSAAWKLRHARALRRSHAVPLFFAGAYLCAWILLGLAGLRSFL